MAISRACRQPASFAATLSAFHESPDSSTPTMTTMTASCSADYLRCPAAAVSFAEWLDDRSRRGRARQAPRSRDGAAFDDARAAAGCPVTDRAGEHGQQGE